jgi:hypothetical protein
MAEMFYYQRGPIEQKGFEYYVRFERMLHNRSKENLVSLVGEYSHFQGEYVRHIPELIEIIDNFGQQLLLHGNVDDQIRSFLNTTAEMEQFKIVDSLKYIELQKMCLKHMKNDTRLDNNTNFNEAFFIFENVNNGDLRNLGFSRLINSLNESNNYDLIQEFLEKVEQKYSESYINQRLFDVWEKYLEKMTLNDAIQRIKYFRTLKLQTKSLNFLVQRKKDEDALFIIDYIMELENFNGPKDEKLLSDLVRKIPYDDAKLENLMLKSNLTVHQFTSNKLQSLAIKSELKKLIAAESSRVIDFAYDLIVRYESGEKEVKNLIDLLPENVRNLVNEKPICLRNKGRYLYTEDFEAVKMTKDTQKPKYAIWRLGKLYSGKFYYLMHQHSFKYVLPENDGEDNEVVKVELNFDSDLGSVWNVEFRESFGKIQLAYEGKKYLVAGKRNVFLKSVEVPTKWDIESC